MATCIHVTSFAVSQQVRRVTNRLELTIHWMEDMFVPLFTGGYKSVKRLDFLDEAAFRLGGWTWLWSIQCVLISIVTLYELLWKHSLVMFLYCSQLRLGFVLALRLVLRLRPGGILSMGPPCGSFIWCNLATSLRSLLNPLGNLDLPHVILGNVFLGQT